MPIDYVFTGALCSELDRALKGARIDKVQQPSRDLLILSVYTSEGNKRLLLSAGVGTARLHFTQERYENPETPPMFCMLMRKHFGGGRIESVERSEGERIAEISVLTRDELGVESRRRIIIELLGRSSNIIAVDETGRITDCIRRADFGADAYRSLIPGMIYKLPKPQEKPDFWGIAPTERRAILKDIDEGSDLQKALMSRFSGLSPLIAGEISARAGGLRENLAAASEAMCESVAAGEFTPCLLAEGDKPLDFTFMPIRQYGDRVALAEYATFSELLDIYYAQRERGELMRRLSGDLARSLRTLRERQARKLSRQRQELMQSVDREDVKRRAELISANIWRMQKGDSVLVCEDYFTEGSPQIEIKLDVRKSPQKNAASLFKEYKKAQAAETYLTELIAKGEGTLQYLESVSDLLERAEGTAEVEEIKRELSAAGFLKQKTKSKSKKPPKSAGPLRFVSSTGFEILVGRTNAQNDELTLKTARRTDIWLHTKSVHGSHVIIRTDGKEVDADTIIEAAELAVYYSQARDGGKTEVDYTQVRNVKKPSGALPGMVIYTDYKSVNVESKSKNL